MAQLTVREKEHWKERISRRVDQAIEKLVARSDRRYLTRITESAREMALDSLSIQKLQTKLAELNSKEELLREERQQTYRAMMVQATGQSIETLPATYYALPGDVERAIAKRAELHEKELLEKDELGRQILALREEKEEMLDTVWLATSGKHIRELWTSVTELLQEQPTRLQSKALAMKPDSEQE